MIEVVGVGARGWQDLPDSLRKLVGDAEVLLGGPRQLELIAAIEGQRRITWPSPLREQLPGLIAELGSRRVVALASGDPLLAGIGTTLIEVLGAQRVRVHPAVSSVALARARMGWPADSAEVVRLRGDDLDQLRRVVFDRARLVILSRDADSPAEIAALLTGVGFGASWMSVLGDLGSDAEVRTDALARDWRAAAPALNVVCVECAGPPGGSLSPGLPDEAYENDGQLTKRNLRASALAHLMPRPGQLLWDLGAGAGSVGIEWLRAHPTCRAIAVERDADRATRITRNACALGVPRLLVVNEATSTALAGLPAPDAVFLGGGLAPELIEHAWRALPAGGRLVAHAVTLETEQLLIEAYRKFGGELTRILVETLEPLGRFTGWQPARAVVQWSAVKPAERAVSAAATSAGPRPGPHLFPARGRPGPAHENEEKS